MAAESKLETYLKDEVRRRKGATRKVKWIGRRGAPDEMVWVPGWKFPKLAETKAPGLPLEDHQRREHKRLKAMGFKCVKLDSKEDIDKFLRSK